jgi:anaerobic selenocysteine-containing dehydrogenase
LLSIRMRTSPISFEQLREDTKKHPAGRIYDPPSAIVQEARPGSDAKFDVMPDDVAGETRQLLGAARTPEDEGASRARFTHLLSTRRNGNVMNSLGSTLEATLKRVPHNPAYMNPKDIAILGLKPGERVAIASEHGEIETFVQPDAAVRSGVVSISHCWGGLTRGSGPGANVNLLIRCDTDVQSINAMPQMSALPISVRKAEGEAAPVGLGGRGDISGRVPASVPRR